MFFADINHYLEAICNSKGRFKTLGSIDFYLDNRGNVDFQAGSNAVIFKGALHGKKIAMKCYTKARNTQKNRQKIVTDYLNSLNSRYLSSSKYLDHEIYLFDDLGNGMYHPVTLTEWVEGISLRNWLTEKCRIKDLGALARMAEKFKEMALWLLDQKWAHGDLKPDNIIVTPENDLRLIDYDCAFVPELAGTLSPELGTPGFQHPARNAEFYNTHLDDYSILVITCALYALVDFPEWYFEQDDDEKLLFDPDEITEGYSERLHRIKEHWLDRGQTVLYKLARFLNNSTPEISALKKTLNMLPGFDSTPQTIGETVPEIYRDKGLYGYRTQQGIRLTEAIYDDAGPFQENLAAVRIGKKRYYINVDGKKQLDASAYDRIEPFQEGLAAVQRGKKWGYLDRNGTIAIPLEFSQTRSFREGVCAVKKAGKWGYINPKGLFVLEPLFDSASDFREATAVVGLNGKFGFIDYGGNWKTDPHYTFATGFRNGTAMAERNGKSIRLIKEDTDIKEEIINI